MSKLKRVTAYTVYNAINYSWYLPPSIIKHYLDNHYLIHWTKKQVLEYTQNKRIVRQGVTYKPSWLNCVPVDSVPDDTVYLLSFRNPKPAHANITDPVVLISLKRTQPNDC